MTAPILPVVGPGPESIGDGRQSPRRDRLPRRRPTESEDAEESGDTPEPATPEGGRLDIVA